MASPYCTWPPASVWKTLFRKYYSRSTHSKWRHLYVETSCVLLGLKPSLLVDCVSPSAQKLNLFLKEVAEHGGQSRRGGKEKEEEQIRCRDGGLVIKEPVAELGGLSGRGGKEEVSKEECGRSVENLNSHFSKCLSNCCILSVGEDTLLVNMESLSLTWDLKRPADHEGDGLTEHAHSLSTCASSSHPKDSNGGPVYVDITKGLKEPKLIRDKCRSTITHQFKKWLVNVYSSFSETSKNEVIPVITCDTTIDLCTSAHDLCTPHQVELVGQASPRQSDTCPMLQTSDEQLQTRPAAGDNCSQTVIKLNLCTLFGQLLGYPVVYWFDVERSYSLDMVELVCYSVTITSCDLGPLTDTLRTSCLNIEQEELVYSFTVPRCLHFTTSDLVKAWCDEVHKRADTLRLVTEMNMNTVCHSCLAL